MRREILFAVTLALGIPLATPTPAEEGTRLVVHEWGVHQIRLSGEDSYAHPSFAADLPRFIWRFTDSDVSGRGMTAPAKPLLYFYGRGVPRVSVNVRFTEGYATAVWPAPDRIDSHDFPSVGIVSRSPDIPQRIGVPRPRTLAWKDVELGWMDGPRLEDVPAGHWVETARDVDAAPVNTGGDVERFLFYDGVGTRVTPLRFGGTDDRLEVTNAGEEAIDHLFLCRRSGDRGRIAFLETLAPGGTETVDLSLREIDAAFVEAGRDRLETLLRERGLFDKEARGMASIWETDFFGTDGICGVYDWTREQYDADLPIEITPAPDELVRVGLVWVSNIRPRWHEETAAAIRALESDDYQSREAAAETLAAIGPAAIPALEEAAGHDSAEVRSRASGLIERIREEWRLGE